MKIALSGFNRLEQYLFMQILDASGLEIAAIHSSKDFSSLIASLIKNPGYQEFAGHHRIIFGISSIFVDEQEIQYFSGEQIDHLPWKDLSIDVVIDSDDHPELHLNAGASRVLLTKYADDRIPVIVSGANDHLPEERILSCGGSKASCLAPVIRILSGYKEIRTCFITLFGKEEENQFADFSAIPSALASVLPETKDRFLVSHKCIPAPEQSTLMMNAVLKDETDTVSSEKINQLMMNASGSCFSFQKKGEPHAASGMLPIFEADQTMVKECGRHIFSIQFAVSYLPYVCYANQMIQLLCGLADDSN